MYNKQTKKIRPTDVGNKLVKSPVRREGRRDIAGGE